MEEMASGTNCPHARPHFTVYFVVRLWLCDWGLTDKSLPSTKTDVNFPLTPELEVRNSEMKSLQMEAAGSLKHGWRATKPLTPDLHQIMMWATSKPRGCESQFGECNQDFVFRVVLSVQQNWERGTRFPICPWFPHTQPPLLSTSLAEWTFFFN